MNQIYQYDRENRASPRSKLNRISAEGTAEIGPFELRTMLDYLQNQEMIRFHLWGTSLLSSNVKEFDTWIIPDNFLPYYAKLYKKYCVKDNVSQKKEEGLNDKKNNSNNSVSITTKGISQGNNKYLANGPNIQKIINYLATKNKSRKNQQSNKILIETSLSVIANNTNLTPDSIHQALISIRKSMGTKKIGLKISIKRKKDSVIIQEM